MITLKLVSSDDGRHDPGAVNEIGAVVYPIISCCTDLYLNEPSFNITLNVIFCTAT